MDLGLKMSCRKRSRLSDFSTRGGSHSKRSLEFSAASKRPMLPMLPKESSFCGAGGKPASQSIDSCIGTCGRQQLVSTHPSSCQHQAVAVAVAVASTLDVSATSGGGIAALGFGVGEGEGVLKGVGGGTATGTCRAINAWS